MSTGESKLRLADPAASAGPRVAAQAQEAGVRFVRLWFTDILGQLKSFSINACDLEQVVAQGMNFDGASITGFNAIEELDMVAMPDPETFAVLPWRPDAPAVARMFCDILTTDGQPYEGDPRHVLRRALARLEGLGFDGLQVASELEYFLFGDQKGTQVLDEGGYFDLTTLDAGSDIRRDTVLSLERLGVPVSSSHHESGPSQHEIDLAPAGALAAADHCVTTRITVKEIAHAAGWHATFMPKPLHADNGSGMHLHMDLVRGGTSALFDPERPAALSDTGRAFLAGQLLHAREISSVCAQWVNSYKRLVPGFEAPVYVAWSRHNRSALLRVPMRSGDGRRGESGVELRCADPACNPYLTLAALIQAGLDGIEHGHDLGDPMERNLYHLGAGERARLGIHHLPETLGEAIELTAGSELMLRTLGEHIFNRFIEIKRQEWDDYRAEVSEWELERYLPIL